MPKVVNVAGCFEKFTDTYSPEIVGELNEQEIKLARLEGDKCPCRTPKRHGFSPADLRNQD